MGGFHILESMKHWSVVVLACMVSSFSASGLNYAVEDGIVYSQPDGKSLEATLFLPETHGDGLRPAIILLHGGGWLVGSRHELRWYARHFAERGYVALCPSYRMMPRYHFPDCLYDAKAAVRWLRGHAAQYRVDPNRIAVLGASAGGQLAAMLATTGPEDGFEGEENLGPSSAVQVAISLYGALDLTVYENVSNNVRLAGAARIYMDSFLGANATDRQDRFAWASPRVYLNANTCPMLLIQGMQDHLVPSQVAEQFYARLQELGVPSRLITFPSGGHGFDRIRPAVRAACFEAMAVFLDTWLPAPGKQD